MVAETMPDELREKLANDDELAVADIRGPPSYISGHIPGLENPPTATFGPGMFDRERPIETVVPCCIGRSPERVTSVLSGNADADASGLRGGSDTQGGAIEDDTESEDEADLGPASPF